MVAQNLERLRGLLEQQKQEIFEQRQQLTNKGTRANDKVVPLEHADRQELFLQLDIRVLHVIQDIDNALSKMDSANYGVCEGCHKPISQQRLETLPAARYCLSCTEMA